IFQIALPFYAPLRAIGLPAFPTGPIILRTITLLAFLASLIVIYNLAKERGWWAAGALAFIYQMTDGNFLYYSLYIHPDTLQMLFGLCALLFAVGHAKDGRRMSLFAFGLFCGLVQGTKVGGPWLAPTALLVVWLGYQANQGRRVADRTSWTGSIDACSLRDRLILLAGAGLLGFVVSTPYAFLDLYYFRSMWSALRTVT